MCFEGNEDRMLGPIAKAARTAATKAALSKIARGAEGQPAKRNPGANLGKFLHQKKAPAAGTLADSLTALRIGGAFPRDVSRGTSPTTR